jgi:hypothetical protein
MKTTFKVLAFVAAVLVPLTVLGQGGPPPASEPLVKPGWAAIFGPDGKVLDLQGGVDAYFLEDKISDGIGLDMSVNASGDGWVVDNGLVSAANDLGNGYVWARRDAGGNLQVYAGVERLDTPADTWVEFEFHQDLVQVHVGAPWPVHGSLTQGDILARVNFAAGVLSSATFMRWDGSGYQAVAAVGPEGAGGPDVMVCVGAPPLSPIAQEVWDAAGNPVQVRPPNSFIEIGFNVAALLGSNVEFTSVQVRTPEDVILDGFRHIGFFAQRAQ